MPEQEKLRILFRMLITITREEEEKRLEEVLQSMHIPIFFQARGQGTAPSEILDLFGLGARRGSSPQRLSPNSWSNRFWRLCTSTAPLHIRAAASPSRFQSAAFKAMCYRC